MIRIDRFSLKFCTAIEWPAPIRMWPRCWSSAFIGTTKNPASAPIATSSGIAIHRSRTKIIADHDQRPSPCPPAARSPRDERDEARGGHRAASAMPTAVMPCSAVAFDSG